MRYIIATAIWLATPPVTIWLVTFWITLDPTFYLTAAADARVMFAVGCVFFWAVITPVWLGWMDSLS